MIIGVLGPEGSYSEKAAQIWTLRHRLNSVEIQYFADIEDAFLAVVQGKSDLSIVPIENSIEGSVGVTLDLLHENGVEIIGEIVVKIEHCLLSKGGPEKVKVILSHPQGLAQCRHFLKKYFPEAELRSTGSTSHAARLAGEFEEMAAIASPEAAECYRLKVLLPNIQDRKENYTRFIALRAVEKSPAEQALCAEDKENKTDNKSDNKPEKSGKVESQSYSRQEPGHNFRSQKEIEFRPEIEIKPENSSHSVFKTSIIVYLEKDRPGALYEILGAFAKNKINLTRIESRPSKKELGDYYFYIDFEGHISDVLIKETLKDIKSKTDTLKILGSYPAFKTQ
ncbi:prephenate dehydratase [Methanosarcina sp. UBA5]|uniref:prephenate dehydratase n=1 Tax=Methanosarcina sp. UBA5 TaxID=1915593 RepID=UPI0025E6DA17|nr:prephenate dehydratase [Methanosarcina sp. UBA5]